MRRELTRALRLDTGLIGINNRDLKSFVTDLAVTNARPRRVPKDRIVIAESGIFTHADLTRLGSALVRSSSARADASSACGGPADVRPAPPGVTAKQREAAQ